MIYMILAVDIDSALGNSANKNGLPWESISEDFKNFKNTTKKYPYVIMGRPTYEAIVKHLGKPLPGRENIILSQTLQETPHPDVKVFSSIGGILDYIKDKDCCIIGGAKTYESFIPYVDQIFLTRVHDHHTADCWLKNELLDDFYEDTVLRTTLRESSETLPLVTLHIYKRHIAA